MTCSTSLVPARFGGVDWTRIRGSRTATLFFLAGEIAGQTAVTEADQPDGVFC